MQYNIDIDHRRLVWRKSTASNPSGNCVELAKLTNGQVALRNSRFPDGPVLLSSPSAVAALLTAVNRGDLDDLAG